MKHKKMEDKTPEQELHNKIREAFAEDNSKYVLMKLINSIARDYADLKVAEALKEQREADSEPCFGWCDVNGCDNEGCSGGNAWKDSGYWTVCSKHSQEYREEKPQPRMKQKAIDRENSRDSNGILQQQTEKK